MRLGLNKWKGLGLALLGLLGPRAARAVAVVPLTAVGTFLDFQQPSAPHPNGFNPHQMGMLKK